MNDAYTDEQIDILLNGRLRNKPPRPKPYPTLAVDMGVPEHTGLNELYWKMITGYTGTDPDGPRRVYKRTKLREDRTGRAWLPCDTEAVKDALFGAGQRRAPACDVKYIAAVLARSVGEIEGFLKKYRPGRTGEGLIY